MEDWKQFPTNLKHQYASKLAKLSLAVIECATVNSEVTVSVLAPRKKSNQNPPISLLKLLHNTKRSSEDAKERPMPELLPIA